MADNTVLNLGSGGDTIATDDIGGVKYQRIKLIYGPDNTNSGDVDIGNPLPVFLVDTARTLVHFWATGAAAGTTGTETAISLTRSTSPGGATSAAASFVVTSGKRFRLTSLAFANRGNNTASTTGATSDFKLRVNTAGAVTTTSNIWIQGRAAVGAVAAAYDRFYINFGDMGPEVLGDGTLQIGVTAAATYTTNAPTWDVLITGYEY